MNRYWWIPLPGATIAAAAIAMLYTLVFPTEVAFVLATVTGIACGVIGFLVAMALREK